MKPIYVYIQTDLRLVVFKNLHCQVLFKARSCPVLGAVVLPSFRPSHPWPPHLCVLPLRIIATPLASRSVPAGQVHSCGVQIYRCPDLSLPTCVNAFWLRRFLSHIMKRWR